MDRYGLDFSLSFDDKGKYLVNLSLFPIVNGVEKREKPLFSNNFSFENESKIIEKIDEIHKIATNVNKEVDLYLLPNSLEETIIFTQNAQNNYNIKKMGVVKHREVKEISDKRTFDGSKSNNKSRNRGFLGRKKSNFKYPKVKEKSKKPYIEKSRCSDIELIRGDISKESYFFIDLDVNYHSFLKTYEIKMKGFSNYNKLNKGHSLFDNSTFFQNTYQDSREAFLDFALPHIKYNQSRGKNICLYSTHKSLQFINILNNKLKEEGLKPIIVRLKTKELSEKEILLSQQRIEDKMKGTYQDLQNLDDKHVVYCDGAHFPNNKLISGAFIFREKGKEDYWRNKFERIQSNSERSSDHAEVLALRQALRFIDRSGKGDKPIHFVFDSDFVFKNLNCIMEGKPTYEQSLYQNDFNEIRKIIERNNLDIKSIVLKSHQFGDINNNFKEVVGYNEKVDKITKYNKPKESEIFRLKKAKI